MTDKAIEVQVSGAVTTALNDWARTANKAQGQREAAQAATEGAYAALMTAGGQFASDNSDIAGEELGEAFRAVVHRQRTEVWAKAPRSYGRVVKVTENKKGETVVSLSGSAANALSVIVGAFGFGMTLDGSFTDLRKDVEAKRRELRDAAAIREHGEEVVQLRQELTDTLSALSGRINKLDDPADLRAVTEALRTVETAVAQAEALMKANAEQPKMNAESVKASRKRVEAEDAEASAALKRAAA